MRSISRFGRPRRIAPSRQVAVAPATSATMALAAGPFNGDDSQRYLGNMSLPVRATNHDRFQSGRNLWS